MTKDKNFINKINKPAEFGIAVLCACVAQLVCAYICTNILNIPSVYAFMLKCMAGLIAAFAFECKITSMQKKYSK